MVLPKFVLFEPNKGYLTDESAYVAWTVLKQRAHQKVEFIFAPMDELDKKTLNEKINISICERIVTMRKACKN
uniref:Uncharacterized protein n=1 Tax=Acrobeloides nanus TaxID=290746 RepID=A0A914DBU2_9BILA